MSLEMPIYGEPRQLGSQFESGSIYAPVSNCDIYKAALRNVFKPTYKNVLAYLSFAERNVHDMLGDILDHLLETDMTHYATIMPFRAEIEQTVSEFWAARAWEQHMEEGQADMRPANFADLLSKVVTSLISGKTIDDALAPYIQEEKFS